MINLSSSQRRLGSSPFVTQKYAGLDASLRWQDGVYFKYACSYLNTRMIWILNRLRHGLVGSLLCDLIGNRLLGIHRKRSSNGAGASPLPERFILKSLYLGVGCLQLEAIARVDRLHFIAIKPV